MAEFQKCLERRHVDYKARFFDDLEAFARACCHESPFQVFRRKDDQLIVGHRFNNGRQEMFSDPVPSLSVHSAEFYQMVVRKESPKILWTRMNDLQVVIGKLLKLGLTERPAKDVLEDLDRDAEIDIRKGALINIIFTLRNSDLLEFKARGQGPMNGDLSLRRGVVPLVAAQEVKSLARANVEKVLGAVNAREIERLFGDMPAFQLRPVD